MSNPVFLSIYADGKLYVHRDDYVVPNAGESVQPTTRKALTGNRTEVSNPPRSAITVCDAPKAGRPSCTGHRAAQDSHAVWKAEKPRCISLKIARNRRNSCLGNT